MKANKYNLKSCFPEKWEEINKLLTGETSPDTYNSVSYWVKQCYNEPSKEEKIEVALNQILEGFGIETISGDYVNPFYQTIIALYVNLGDTYIATLLFDTNKKRWLITSFGDFVEKNQKKYNKTRKIIAAKTIAINSFVSTIFYFFPFYL